jgi:HlyD family secretion protein
MTRTRILLVSVLAAGAAAAVWFWPRQSDGPTPFQGYVEGQLSYVAAEDGGRITKLDLVEGDHAAAEQVVGTLDPAMQIGQRDEATAKLAQARSTLANLKAAQQRPEQIAVLEAQVDRAEAALAYSAQEFTRQSNLLDRGYAAQSALDQAKAAYDRDTAALAEAKREIEAARLTARTDEIEAAEAAVRAAEAALAQAETRLSKRRLVAPAEATVQEVFFRPGEVVVAGQPVMSLLPPDGLKVRFYVPEGRLAGLALGQEVSVTCDSCPGPIRAKVSFMASEAEYTPPVIFSEEERSKLVFRVEARPVDGRPLPLGLPVAVLPAAEGRETAHAGP